MGTYRPARPRDASWDLRGQLGPERPAGARQVRVPAGSIETSWELRGQLVTERLRPERLSPEKAAGLRGARLSQSRERKAVASSRA